jgi:hypothetical protein
VGEEKQKGGKAGSRHLHVLTLLFRGFSGAAERHYKYKFIFIFIYYYEYIFILLCLYSPLQRH